MQVFLKKIEKLFFRGKKEEGRMALAEMQDGDETHDVDETQNVASLRVLQYHMVGWKGKIATIDRSGVSNCKVLARAPGMEVDSPQRRR